MDDIRKKFGDRIRIRVCGLLYQEDSLLMVQHESLGESNNLWAPPGGALEFGETVMDALFREVSEETGLMIQEAHFQFVNEFIAPPLHAIELFFHVTRYSGKLKTGSDPEMKEAQIIKNVKFVTFNELSIMNDSEKHNILHGNPSVERLQTLIGYHMFHPLK